MAKRFRITRNELSREGEQDSSPLLYRIEQRCTILFFIHWWDAPIFEPPHNFRSVSEAFMAITSHYPDAVISYDCSHLRPMDYETE